MNDEFDLADLESTHADCEEYEPGHHLGRPFMSAYQIAIRFAEEHPDHALVETLPLGGEGTGSHQSLVQRIARFLSQAIRDGRAEHIEGGFISHDCIEDFSFNSEDGIVRVSIQGAYAFLAHRQEALLDELY